MRDSAVRTLEFIDDASYNWIRTILDSVNNGVIIVDHRGIIRYANDDYTSITGTDRHKIIGKKLLDVRPNAVSPIVIKNKKPMKGVYRKAGNKEYIADISPIFDGDILIGTVAIFKSLADVSELSKNFQKSLKTIATLERTVKEFHKAKYDFNDIIGENPVLKHSINLSKKVANSELNVLIIGENGTGKELFAHSIHNNSKRAHHPFVPVNCAAIPETLMESEFFGYEGGSFTSSQKDGKIGLFEQANNGTLFLDEIGDMSLDLQAKILRVIQEGTIRRVGSTKEKKVDVRIIAATNKDLSKMVEKNQFREDLYYRLNGMTIKVPPLRHRKDDIKILVNHIFEKSQKNLELTQNYYFSDEAMEALYYYHWPGNVRELINAVRHAIILATNQEIKLEDLPDSISNNISRNTQTHRTLKEWLDLKEKEIIELTIKQYGDDLEGKKNAAKSLGISLSTLYNKIKNN